jgi:protein-tyrosine phosphatase
MKKYSILLSLLFILLTTTIYAQDSAIVFHPKRKITLEAGSNFRDLGGYPTSNNKIVAWGQIYRSADISKLTDADLIHLGQLEIATVCDLRGPSELKTNPDRIPVGVNYINLPAGSENVQTSLNYGKINSDSLMQSMYSNTNFLVAKYKPMFDELLSLKKGKALLFHCTAGKDRTGIGAALILSALDVPRTYVEADYAATNLFWKDAQERMIAMMQKSGMPLDKAKSMIAANPLYIQTFLNTINQKFGSMSQFLKTEMKLSDTDLQKLKVRFTE